MPQFVDGEHADDIRGKINAAIATVDAAELPWTTWQSVITGFSPAPFQLCQELKIGKTVWVEITISGASNSTSFTFTLNTIPKSTIMHVGQATSAGAKTTGAVKLNTGSAVCDVFTNIGETLGFNALGTKELKISFCYQAE